MKTTTVLTILITAVISMSSYGQFDKISDDLEVTIYPKDRQSERTQQRDESKCYEYAEDRTDIDPLYQFNNNRYNRDRRNDDRRENEDKNENSFTKRALGGAALGTLIGALSGNTTKGLSYGALAGGVYGGIGELTEDKNDDRDVRENYSDRDLKKFKRSFCSCMEDQDYYAEY